MSKNTVLAEHLVERIGQPYLTQGQSVRFTGTRMATVPQKSY